MDKRYPIGSFQMPKEKNNRQFQSFIADINELPEKLREAVQGLTEEQIDSSYREGGWTIRQVVHHLADAHMNAFIRTKLALTEDTPTINPFEENEWAVTEEAKEAPVELSLSLLDGLQKRWAFLLERLEEQDVNKTVYHPGLEKELDVYTLAALYAWHGKHHTAHIVNAE
ncbi:YfiT family bacillithiol transferase [Priestia abyssalis]|uniref:YfiT family bacillithiol transferase n=1 Tax=Priestia abyssalis TaxID=1221450 RepID=UPI0009956689|nr:putative metal-dependent hydrolase [Priestia abyssalis]